MRPASPDQRVPAVEHDSTRFSTKGDGLKHFKEALVRLSAKVPPTP